MTNHRHPVAIRNLARARFAAGQKVSHIAHTLGVSRQTVSYWVRAERTAPRRRGPYPPALRRQALASYAAGATVPAIAHALGIDHGTIRSWISRAPPSALIPPGPPLLLAAGHYWPTITGWGPRT